MTILAFPDVSSADEHGLLAIGGDLEVPSLLLAYRSGIFPWPLDEETLAWFAPPKRAVLFFDRIHVARSLERERRRSTLEFKFDQNFAAVIQACAETTNRTKQQGTWITDDIIDAYCALHKSGIAHSIEAYQDGELVGGLYGVSIGAMFAGESMFYRAPNASKLALLYLCDYLGNCGGEWLDCQVLTPHMTQLGAQEIPRAKFMQLLSKALAKTSIW